MTLTVRNLQHNYREVVVEHDNTHTSLSSHNPQESRQLAKELIESAWALGAMDFDECREFFLGICEEVGIKLKMR